MKTPSTLAAKKSPRRIGAKGQDLVPDLAANVDRITVQNWYWIGALPGCPRESLDVGGISFPKMTEAVRLDKSGNTHRVPRIGALAQLTSIQIERIRETLPDRVIRFTGTEPETDGVGEGLESLDEDNARRKGHAIRIPTSEQVKAGKRAYTQDPRDEPAARYLFAELCQNQDRPQYSDRYPEPLEVTGLEWPGED